MTRIHGDDAHGQVKRVVERFALVAVAGELAIEWGIVEWTMGDCIEAAFACLESWMNDHREGGLSSSEEEKIVEQVRHFFESQSSRFDSLVTKSTFKCNNRAGFKNDAQYGNTAGDYYVFTTNFKKEICKNYEPRLVATILSKRGLLYLPEKGNDMSISIRVPADNNKHYRLYHLSARIFEAKEEKEISNN